MASVLALVLIFVAFIKISSLSSELKKLQGEIFELKSGKRTSSPDSVVHHDDSQTRILEQFLQPQTGNSTEIRRDYTPAVDEGFDIGAWFKENWLLKVGVLMILAGFGWFVNYAFSHDWIGPVGRIVLGFVSGTLLTLFGAMRVQKSEVQSNTFSILGSSLIIITALAGQYFYGFFPSGVILAIIFLVSAYITFFAVVHSNKNLAGYGLLASLIAPYFSHVVLIDHVNFYLYLFVVSLSTLWVAGKKDWRELLAIGISGVGLYALLDFDTELAIYSSKYALLLVVYAISTLYLLVGVWGLVKNKIKADGIDTYLTVVNTGLLLLFTMRIVPSIYQSLVIAAWMIVYACAGAFVFAKTKNVALFYLHALASIVLLGVATSIELSGPTLVIAFALEAAIISAAAYVVTDRVETAEKFGLLLLLPYVLSLPSLISSKWMSGVFHSDFAILAVMAFVSFMLGGLYQLADTKGRVGFRAAHLCFIISTFYVYVLIWLSLHASLADADTAAFISLLVYTIVGLITHFMGLFSHHIVLKKYGMTMLVLVVIRLVLVDVWNMDLSLRVVTFIVLGTLFVSTAFISKKQDAVIGSSNV